jgi:hypothetical protein
VEQTENMYIMTIRYVTYSLIIEINKELVIRSSLVVTATLPVLCFAPVSSPQTMCASRWLYVIRSALSHPNTAYLERIQLQLNVLLEALRMIERAAKPNRDRLKLNIFTVIDADHLHHTLLMAAAPESEELLEHVV